MVGIERQRADKKAYIQFTLSIQLYSNHHDIHSLSVPSGHLSIFSRLYLFWVLHEEPNSPRDGRHIQLQAINFHVFYIIALYVFLYPYIPQGHHTWFFGKCFSCTVYPGEIITIQTSNGQNYIYLEHHHEQNMND